MKIPIKNGFILLILGVGLMFVSAFTTGFDFNRYTTSKQDTYTEHTIHLDPKITSLTIHDDLMPIRIKESQDEQIHITYFESDRQWYDINEGISFKMVKKSKHSFLDFIGFNWKSYEIPEMVIELPNGFVGDIEIETSNAKISGEYLTGGHIDIESSNAKIELKGVQATSLDIGASNAVIYLEEMNVKEQLTAKTSNGLIEVSNIVAEDVEIKTSNGKLMLDTAKLRTLKATTSNGPIGFEQVQVDSGIWLKTSNGSIKGTIIGDVDDFQVRSETSFGDSNLVETNTGTIILSAETSNGNIKIDFIK